MDEEGEEAAVYGEEDHAGRYLDGSHDIDCSNFNRTASQGLPPLFFSIELNDESERSQHRYTREGLKI